MIRPFPEILAPAGTLAKLRTAFYFGADAAYLGLKQFSLRARAGNFDLDQLAEAITLARDLGKKIYVAVNIQPFDSDLPHIEKALQNLARLSPDGIIVADPAVLSLARENAGAIPLHLSTQASVTNARAARFWHGQGVSRIIAARELSLGQLATLVRDGGVEIEAFVHGAVCVAYSGRCLMSLYWARRDPRRGGCAQACRWRFRAIEDTRRPGEQHPIEQDERGSYLFDAKDLCALPVLDELVATGVSALKIEGRTRSRHYVGVTVDVYRHALDTLTGQGTESFRANIPRYVEELAGASGRGLSTHFLTGEQDRVESYITHGSYPHGRHTFVGEVVSKAGSKLVVEAQNPVRPGTVVEVVDAGLQRHRTRLDTITTPQGASLEMARTGDRFVLPPGVSCQVGALLRKAGPVDASTKGQGRK